MTRIRRLAEEEFLLIVLIAAFGVTFVSVFPPTLLVADTWLTLVGGREVWEHGLPSHDELAVLTLGRVWTDQQWGAQLIAYGTHALGGHALLAVVTAIFVVGAFAIAAIGARKLGAGPRAILLVFFPVILAAPWAWTMRAQVFALPLFTGLVWLLASEARNPSAGAYSSSSRSSSSGRTSTAACRARRSADDASGRHRARQKPRPLGAAERRPRRPRHRSPCSRHRMGPFDTADYYRLLLLDPPFPRELVTEWRASDPGTDTLLFYALAATPRSSCSRSGVGA